MPVKPLKVKKMEGQSVNMQADLLKLLSSQAPEVFTEGRVDAAKLRQTLGENMEEGEERYGLNWAGKTDCFKRIQETTTNTLKPCREESVDFDTTQNLFIEGDNLQVLKTLQRSYYGKVKMIYIDPPYNTGNDFVYNDAFGEVRKEYLKKAGAIDEDGNVLEDGLYRRNTKDGGHYHSNWLNMMYPRLFLARNLLRRDGIIFVSIDDSEVNNLRGMMDEIFGSENFISCLIRRTKVGGGSASKWFAVEHDYVLVYVKNKEDSKELFLPYDDEYLKRFKEKDNDGVYYWDTFERSYTGTTPYKIQAPNGQLLQGSWFKSEESFKADLAKGDIRFVEKKDGSWSVQIKTRPAEGKKMRSLLVDNDYKSSQDDLIELGISEVFDFPKPMKLITDLIAVSTSEDDVVMDFFAGSGTTAHSVMKLNAEDGGKRRWICVQLPEKCQEDSEAAKAGFDTIADIAKERIRRAGKKIEEEVSSHRSVYNGLRDEIGYKKREVGEIQADDTGMRYDFDFGFKVYKLDESNFKIWNTHIESQEQLEQQMMDFIDNVRGDATQENLLHELILKSGQELTVTVETKKVGKAAYHRIGDGSLVICLDEISEKLFVEILADKPKKIVLLDRAFKGNDQLKTNMLLKAEDDGVEVLVV